MFTYLLPVPGDHYKIALGKQFSKLNQIKKRFNVKIQFKNPDHQNQRPDYYFIIQGLEKDVNQCTMEIQRLVIISMNNLINKRFNRYNVPPISYDEKPVSPTNSPPQSPTYSPPPTSQPVSSANTQ